MTKGFYLSLDECWGSGQDATWFFSQRRLNVEYFAAASRAFSICRLVETEALMPMSTFCCELVYFHGI
jgi:hypothetical protein